MVQNLNLVLKHRVYTRLKAENKDLGFLMLYTVIGITKRKAKSKKQEKQLHTTIVSADRSSPQHQSTTVGEGRCIFVTNNFSLLQYVANNFGKVSCAIDDVKMMGAAKAEIAQLVLNMPQVRWYAVMISSGADNHLGGAIMHSSTMAKRNTWYKRVSEGFRVISSP
jgi:hypothetical protein